MNDEVWRLENPRRDPFADMAKVGEILEQDDKLSIARIQRKLGIGFTYAHRILDYLINSGELYHAGDGVYLSERLTQRAPDRVVRTAKSDESTNDE